MTAEFAFTDLARDIQALQVQMPDGTSPAIPLSELIDTVSGTLTVAFDVSTSELGACIVDIGLIDAAGNVSNSVSADVRVESPVPEIAILGPAEVLSGTIGFNLSVTGSDFMTGATVTWDGVDRMTEYASDTQVFAAIPATDLVTAGNGSAPGGL